MTQPQTMSGKTCIVTGANSGIGKETALGLACMGAHVVLVCRNAEKGRAALADIQRESGSSRLDLLIADMSSMASVRALATQILEKHPRVDVLINNAGTAISKRRLSVDGIEMTIAGNHLGAFLLTLLLLDRLKASAPSRIVNVSSEAQRRARLEMDDIQFERRKYSSLGAYGQSKVLMNACTFELARRLKGTGVTANCLHPGVVDEYLALGRGGSAAVFQDSCRDLQAVHDRFEERRGGVALSRRFPGRRRSHGNVFREIEARSLQSHRARSESIRGNLAVERENDRRAAGVAPRQ